MISVITINLNNGKGLSDTISSVANQTYSNVEHIIIDGGSIDTSLDILQANSSKLKWISEKDNGINAAMNSGIEMASGDYLLFLHSGDYLCNNEVLENLLANQNGTYDLIYGNIEKILKTGEHVVEKMPAKLSFRFMEQSGLYRTTTLIRKKLFQQIGKFDEQITLAADWVFLFRAVVLENATYLYKDINVAVFSMDGITSKLGKQSFIKAEKKRAFEHYLSAPLLEYYQEGERNKRYADFRYFDKGLKLWYKKNDYQKWLKQLFYSVQAPFKKMDTLAQVAKLKKTFDYKQIPIIINNFNRLSYLTDLIGSLEKRGYTNLYILDNMSTYEPLLEYYKTTPYKIYHLKENIGLSALWDSGVFSDFQNQYYVYTDSDLKIVEECPDDFLLLFYVLLNKYPKYDKVGFSIKINDLPDYYHNKEAVIQWEKSLNIYKLENLAHEAIIDTTFALYRPAVKVTKLMYEALRVDKPYQVYHLPWYENTNELTQEQLYYLDNLSKKVFTQWSIKAADTTNP